MRYRMLNHAEVIDTVNREVVAVRYNVTKSGFPIGIPALDRWAEAYKRNPWTRMIYGHYILVRADGEFAYGCSRCQCVEIMLEKNPFGHAFADLKTFIAQAKEETALRARVAAGGPEAAEAEAELADLHAAMHEEILDRSLCVTDLRLLTARFVNDWGAAPWAEVLHVLDEDRVEPGVRNAAIHALGDFILNDAPFDPKTEKHLKALYELLNPAEVESLFNAVGEVAKPEILKMNIGHFPLPPSLRRVAAVGLGVLCDQPFREDDPFVVFRARDWWAQHRGDAAWSLEAIQTYNLRTEPIVLAPGSQD